MKSSGPWNLRGLRPEAREAARQAARRSGMSVGEWLNSVIRPADEDDEWSADFGPETEEQSPPRRRRDDGEREQHPGADRRRREPDDYWAQSRRQESRRQESRRKESRRQESRRQESLRRESLRQESLRQESLRQENLRQDSRRQDDRVPEKYRETNDDRRDRNRDDEPSVPRESAPYREDHRGSGQPYYEEPRRERPIQSRREREDFHQHRDESYVGRPHHEPPVFEPVTISKRPRNARRSTDATSLQPPGRRMTKSRAGNAPSNPVASGRIFINTMMKAMRAVRVVNRRCSSRMSSRFILNRPTNARR